MLFKTTVYKIYNDEIHNNNNNRNTNVVIKCSAHDAVFWNNLHRVLSKSKDWKAK